MGPSTGACGYVARAEARLIHAERVGACGRIVVWAGAVSLGYGLNLDAWARRSIMFGDEDRFLNVMAKWIKLLGLFSLPPRPWAHSAIGDLDIWWPPCASLRNAGA